MYRIGPVALEQAIERYVFEREVIEREVIERQLVEHRTVPSQVVQQNCFWNRSYSSQLDSECAVTVEGA